MTLTPDQLSALLQASALRQEGNTHTADAIEELVRAELMNQTHSP